MFPPWSSLDPATTVHAGVRLERVRDRREDLRSGPDGPRSPSGVGSSPPAAHLLRPRHPLAPLAVAGFVTVAPLVLSTPLRFARGSAFGLDSASPRSESRTGPQRGAEVQCEESASGLLVLARRGPSFTSCGTRHPAAMRRSAPDVGVWWLNRRRHGRSPVGSGSKRSARLAAAPHRTAPAGPAQRSPDRPEGTDALGSSASSWFRRWCWSLAFAMFRGGVGHSEPGLLGAVL
jgi:hypothetical protein